MIMDMQIGVFCGLFSIIASLIVYAILSFYSIKEDSFDEARANRRKLIKEYLDQSRTNCDKTKQKKSKKVSKKIKDKKPELIIEDSIEVKKEGKIHDSTKEAVQLVKEMVANKKNDTANKGTMKVKVHTADKEEQVQTVVTAIPPSETVFKKMSEKKGKKFLEKQVESDAVSLSHTPKEGEKKAKVEIKSDKKKSENVLQSTTIRKQLGGTDKQVINVNFILSLIQKAELARSEIQLLIDTLLNSEDEKSEWLKVKKLDSGRQDSSVKLRKQLSELEGLLKNEKQITLSLQNKLKELRSDMASDKTNVSMLKDAVNRIQQEKDDLLFEKSDLSLKLKTTTDEKNELLEQLNREKSNIQHQQKLDDDRHHDLVLSLQAEIKNFTSQLEDSQNENSSLQSSLSFLKDELKSHQNCQENIADLEKTLDTLSEKLDEKDSEISHSRKQVDAITSVVDKFKKENQELRTEIENLVVQLSDSSRQHDNLKEELEALLLEKTENENVAVGIENGNVTNGFGASHDTVNYQLLLEEKNNLLKQMSSDFESSNANLNELKNKLVEANDESGHLKSLLEQANADISLLKGKVTKLNNRNEEYEEVIFKLRNIINEKSDELNLLNGEIEKHKQRNNELRNKNWKVVEALSSAEKALQNKLKSGEVDNGGNSYRNIEELKNNVNTFVRRLFPDITIQEYKGHFNEWLRSVEEAVTSNNLKYFPRDLQSQNSQLQSLVSHYKNIISDTEDMLNKLQNHIEVEESKWKENLTSLQNELDTLRALNKYTS